MYKIFHGWNKNYYNKVFPINTNFEKNFTIFYFFSSYPYITTNIPTVKVWDTEIRQKIS